MRKLLLTGFTLALLFFLNNKTDAQLKNIVQHAKDKTADKVNNAVDNSANSSANSSDNSNSNTETPDNSNQSQTGADQTPAAPPSVTAYQNYDFRAGDKIIFEDNFATDEDGEFPAHWDLNKGQAVVNKVTGLPAFLLTDGNYCGVAPRIKTESYLTDNFSVNLIRI